MTNSHEHHLTVSRTARYHTLGTAGAATREVWFALHGHGQLAAYFIRHFAAVEDPARLVVAPEGLNRFYMETTSWKGAGHARVGATWMTREDRLAEISDYVGYLDALHDTVFNQLPRQQVRVLVRGFSQGVSTACRWLAQGKARADTLVMWAGPMPPEIDADSAAPLRRSRIIRVLGENDETASADIRVAARARMSSLLLEASDVSVPGGHTLDAGVLRTLQA